MVHHRGVSPTPLAAAGLLSARRLHAVLKWGVFVDTGSNSIKTGGPAKGEIAVLGGKHFNLNQYPKWAEWELNPRHMDFQSIALPTELSARQC